MHKLKMLHRMGLFLIFWMAVFATILEAIDASQLQNGKGFRIGGKHRVFVSTDIGGTDPDDFQSMVHLLLYADILEIEGLVSSPYGPGRSSDILRVIDQYEVDYPNLIRHSADYPTPAQLRSITRQGEIEVAPHHGFREATDGSRLLIQCARRHEPGRPLHVLVWGGLEDLAQALHDAPDIVNDIRVYWIGGPNKKWSPDAYQYILSHHSNLFFIEANSTYRGWFNGGVGNTDLNDKPAGIDEYSNSGFVTEHVKNHGALGAFFADKLGGTIKMGDSPSVGWVLNGNPADPSAPGWGGQFVRAWRRPGLQLDRLPNENDRLEMAGILEMAIPAGTEIPIDHQTFLHVENQSLAGTSSPDNTMRFRFSPKAVRLFKFTISSRIEGLNGLTGELTVDAATPVYATHPDSELTNWWTDNPAASMAEGEHQGARSVSIWRKDFLDDFAARMDRCLPIPTP